MPLIYFKKDNYEWRPSRNNAYTIPNEDNYHIALGRTSAGELNKSTTNIKTRTVQLVWPHMPKADVDGLISFLDTALNKGIESFIYVDPNGTEHTVDWVDSGGKLAWPEAYYESFPVTITLEELL